MGQYFPSTIKRFQDQSTVGNNMMPSSDYSIGGFDSNTGAYSDPTYMGFRVLFQTASNMSESELHYDYDSLPQGLLLNPKNAYSTQNYFYRLRDTKDQLYINRFREGLFKIDKDMPWYIQSITGLDEIYKIDPENNYRAKDKTITLTFLEDVKLQMTYLFDLYRKSIWDAKYMRWKVPENMRKFGMEVYLIDIRNFQSFNPVAGTDGSHDWDWFDPTRPMRAVDTLRGELKGALSSMKSKLMAGGANGKLNEKFYYDSTESRNSNLRHSADAFLPVLKLELEDCEFNLIQDGLSGFGDISNTVAGDPREVSLTINIGNVREVNQYSLFDVILDDNGSMYDDLLQITKDMYKIAKDTDPDTDPVNPAQTSAPNPLLEKIKNRALQEIIGRLSDKAKEYINPFLLGNIYGLSPTDLQNSIDNLLKKNEGETSLRKNIDLEGTGKTHVNNMTDNIDREGIEPNDSITDNIDLEGINPNNNIPTNIDFADPYDGADKPSPKNIYDGENPPDPNKPTSRNIELNETLTNETVLNNIELEGTELNKNVPNSNINYENNEIGTGKPSPKNIIDELERRKLERSKEKPSENNLYDNETSKPNKPSPRNINFNGPSS